MQLDKRAQKAHSIIKYKAYTALIEGKIDQQQYSMLTELGFLDKVKAFFGGGAEVGGDLAKLFKDKVAQKQLTIAKDNITKAVKDLKDVASKAGVNDGVVNEFLKSVFDGVGVDPAQVAAAKPGEGGDKAGGGDQTAAKGQSVEKALEKSPAAVAKAVADVTGQPEEKVAAELEKKKPDAAALSGVLGNAIAKNIGIDAKIVTDVVKALLDKGHLKLEGGRPLDRKGIMNFYKEVKDLNEQSDLMNRWLQLAGLNETLLVEREADKAAFEELMKMIDSGEMKTADELQQWLAGPKGAEAGLTKAMKKQLTAAFEKKNPKEDKKKVEKAVEAAPETKAPTEKEPSPAEEKKAEEAKKEYGQAFKDVRAVIDTKVADDATLAKVIDAIDGYKTVAVAA